MSIKKLQIGSSFKVDKHWYRVTDLIVYFDKGKPTVFVEYKKVFVTDAGVGFDVEWDVETLDEFLRLISKER